MSLQTDLGLSDVPNASANGEVIVNQNDVALSLIGFAALGFGDTSPPGSPAEGDFYILGSGAKTGDWSGFADGNIAIYQNSAWVEITKRTGMVVNVSDGSALSTYEFTAGIPNEWVLRSSSGGGGGSSEQIYDIPCVKNTLPTSGEVLARYTVPREVDIPANMSGSVGSVETTPSAEAFIISFTDDGSEIGTITISTGGAFTFATTSGTAKVIAAGSKIEFVAPAGSPSEPAIEGISFTIKATTTDT